ncbi:MAG: phosphoribosylaminoimidazolesuccinocarboxamide synthase [Dehalococcoidia bacterium]|nr:MAG: phosphoribosylaminoimidazolesuccinocarboxamide synthase [Dehalococcoidia bacterium]
MEEQYAYPSILLKTDLPLPLFMRGKTRDVYDLGEQLLIIATDRISAFDVVLPCGIPNKGKVLNQLSAFWFEKTEHIVSNHVLHVVNDVSDLDVYIAEDSRFDYPEYLSGRSMIVKKAQRIPVECVVRGFLSGSAWVEYQNKGTVSSLPIIKGLLESNVLPEPIFTPTTKADEGHDLPMSMDEVQKIVGTSLAKKIKNTSVNIFKFAQKYARIPASFFIADTKFEFGVENGETILIDELLTPDSSRFWDVDSYRVGQHQDSFDKQPVRDWLENSGWNKEPPAPLLPPDVIQQTSERYQQVYQRLMGKILE